MTLHQSRAPFAEQCPVRDVLSRLGDRWSMLVLRELETETVRFGALKNRIGDISQRMLAQTLRRLEEDGLISREVFPTIPPRVEYTLTSLGHSLMVPIKSMVQWADANHEAVRAARDAYIPPPVYNTK